MTPAGAPPATQAIAGDFHGLPTIGLAGGAVWFEALATAGPRIVRLGLAGGESLLAETPDVAWPTAAGPYQLYGGHRLWLAPESAGLQASPDGDGVAVHRRASSLRLTGTPDRGTGCVRSITIRVDPRLPVLRLRHAVRNDGRAPIEAALWAITQLPAGGWAVLPQPPAAAGHGTRPNRHLALWPYTDADDPRLVLRDGLIAVCGGPGRDLKVGSEVEDGWAAWSRGGVALIRRWTPEPDAAYPDRGCNAEVFATERYTELEVLGPVVRLDPGERAVLDETWEVRVVAAEDPASLREELAIPLDPRAAPDAVPQPEA